ncbi:MAG: hypothetical protein KA536_15755 [Saprospiraceae bacterium]|nr:hypothetical protein [Saprospiraceae bacterium]
MKTTNNSARKGGEEIKPGTLHSGQEKPTNAEEIKPGTLHGGEEIKPGTLHARSC